MMPTQAEIRPYRTDGVVCLRGAIDQDWIEQLREGVAADMAEPGPHVEIYTEESDPDSSSTISTSGAMCRR